MLRAIAVLKRDAPRGRVADTLILDFEQRRMQRGEVRGVNGTPIAFDFSGPVTLHTDDALLLDDGSVADVVAAAEPLVEVRADLPALARLAWVLGDRHVPVQFMPNRIRLRADPALDAILSASGGKVTRIEAPFEPEGGAYAAASSGDAHDHSHDDGRSHAHHHRPRTSSCGR